MHIERKIEVKKEKNIESSVLNKKNITVFTAIAVVIMLFAFLTITACKKNDETKSVSGITVGDIEVGNKDINQIKEAVSVLENAFDNSSVILGVEGKSETIKISSSDISLKFDIEKTVDKAFNYGKNSKEKIKNKQKVDIGYEFSYDKDALKNIIENFSQNLGGDLKEHEIKTEGEHVVIKSGKSGKGVYIEEAVDVIIKSFRPNSSMEAKVSMKEKNPEDINIDFLCDYVKKDVQNAKFVLENGAVKVEEEVNGCELDRKDAEEKLKGFTVGSEDIYIKLIITPAQIKKSELSSKLFADVLGQYSSKYASSNKNRSANVERAGQNINGNIIMPGDTFSYNTAVGPRTAERGFKVASVYEANRVADGMGGGICQTCSTLYPAVLYADLGIVERHNHSLEVSYVPLGMDATVAWNSLDFKFKNTTNYPIKIVCSAGGGNVSVKIVGTKEDKSKSIKIITERTSYTPYTTKEVLDNTLAPGAKITESNGFNGSSVNTYKIYYENGKEVKREKLGTSVYRMAEKVLRVGPPAATVTPKPTEAPVVTQNPQTTVEPSETKNPEYESTEVVEEENIITSEEIQNEYPEGI